MKRLSIHFMAPLLVLTVLNACASTSSGLSQAEQVPFNQIKTTPESYRGQVIMLGGQVLDAKRLKDGTRIEVLQLPLESSHAPSIELTQSQGRFVAMQREFLDPATIPPGTFVTATGEITGSITLPLDETEYNYPILDIKELKVWPDSINAPHMRPYMGPMWGPYWGPYWRPYPYYW